MTSSSIPGRWSTGTIVSVTETQIGDALTVAAAAGDTILTLGDTAEFDSIAGGQLQVNDTVYDYTAVDEETDTVTLASGLVADADEGDRVLVIDAGTGSVAIEARALVALPGRQANDDSIDADVAQALVPLLADGLRDAGAGESVTMTERDGTWTVVDVHGRKPTFDADNAIYNDNVVTGAQVDSSSVSISGTVAGSGTSDALASNVVAVGPFSKAGTNSTAVGVGALASTLVGGSGNTAVGRDALSSLTSGEFNTVVGTFSGLSIDTGNHNTVIGEESALDLVDGDYNTFLGQDTGNGHTLLHGSFNTFVGCLTSVTADTSGTVTIGVDSAGNGATATADDEFVLGTSNHLVQVPGRLNVAPRTPSGTADTQGAVGDITSDDNYLYVKTTGGWKRAALSTF